MRVPMVEGHDAGSREEQLTKFDGIPHSRSSRTPSHPRCPLAPPPCSMALPRTVLADHATLVAVLRSPSWPVLNPAMGVAARS